MRTIVQWRVSESRSSGPERGSMDVRYFSWRTYSRTSTCRRIDLQGLRSLTDCSGDSVSLADKTGIPLAVRFGGFHGKQARPRHIDGRFRVLCSVVGPPWG